jgi:peptidoglycan/xylan/chitin deacetylase (PgdA/CDA1 family)
MGKPGILVVSLDFELFWGIRDFARLEEHRECLIRVRRVVPRVLELFRRYGIHATWATVGMLFCSSDAELRRYLPDRLPTYADPSQSPYGDLARTGRDESEDPFHFAPSLIDTIRSVPNQEIGSHTFSHYYCLENGQDREAFRDDLAAALQVARAHGVTLRSLVFPRNQVNPAYLDLCREAGIVAYRGTESSWLHLPRPFQRETRARRLARLLDCYANVSGDHGYPIPAETSERPVNIPSSRLLRRYIPALKWLEGLRQRRILSSMTNAASSGRVFHLWMHPEELAEYPQPNLDFLEGVLSHFARLRRRYGMESLNMAEYAERLHPARLTLARMAS